MAEYGTPYRFNPTARVALEPIRPLSRSFSPLNPQDPFSRVWFGGDATPGGSTSSLERRFLRIVGNARLPTVAVCGTMHRVADVDGGSSSSESSDAGACDESAYVYVLALVEPIDERHPDWINLCLDLEDEAALVTKAHVEVMQTVGWIDDEL